MFAQEIFNSIAWRYDLINTLISFGFDKYWRNKLVQALGRHLDKTKDQQILDVSTGTADLAIETMKQLKPNKIIGIDPAEKMLELGRAKIKKSGFANRISLQKGSAEKLEFADNFFDFAQVSFGIRNFADLNCGLVEIYRVLKSGGILTILEFSYPKNKFLRHVYKLYFNFIMPVIAGILSGNLKAYKYLATSVANFPNPEKLKDILENIGFTVNEVQRLTFGVCSLYLCKK
jgi:demethylmenaquinone methyltransferase/2-methoxy-6-polyprenyl-1,4-benzoquinol methylase